MHLNIFLRECFFLKYNYLDELQKSTLIELEVRVEPILTTSNKK